MSYIKEEGNCVISDLTIGGWTCFKRKLKIGLKNRFKICQDLDGHFNKN